MAKILITDLFGTLIPEDLMSADYLYGTGMERKEFNEIQENKEYCSRLLDDIFIHLSRDLKEFLDDGNYVKIVTSLGAHDPMSFILGELITRLYKFNPGYEKQIDTYFVEGSGTPFDVESLSKPVEEFEKYGHRYFKYDNSIVFGYLPEKTEIFDILKKQHDIENNELYCIGNMNTDVPMLINCIELGGKSSLLKHNLYTYWMINNQSTTEIIRNKAFLDYYLMIEDQILAAYPDYSSIETSDRLKIKHAIEDKYPYKEWFSNRIVELYTLLNNQQLDLNALIEEREIYNILSICQSFPQLKKTYRENHGSELTIYSTFRDYSNKVLSRKRKPQNNN